MTHEYMDIGISCDADSLLFALSSSITPFNPHSGLYFLKGNTFNYMHYIYYYLSHFPFNITLQKKEKTDYHPTSLT